MSPSHPPTRTGPRPSPPGWYPDPLTNGARRRWWTGRDWGDHVLPAAAGPSTPPTPPTQPTPSTLGRSNPPVTPVSRSRVRVPWLRLFGFILIGGLAVFALASGQFLQSLNVFSGEITFYSATGAGADRQTVENGQTEIQTQVAEKKRAAQSTAPKHPAAPADATLTGTWSDDDGEFSYAISQYGAEVVIVEQSAYGVTAVCYGLVDGDQIELAFEAIDGSTGSGQLRLTGKGILEGEFTNSSTQQTTAISLHR